MGAPDMPHMNDVGMQATKDSRPIHRVYMDGFWMDETDITNDDFAAFVKATGYVRSPNASPARRTFQARHPKIWWPAPWCTRPPTTPFRSPIIFNGGPT